MRIDDFSAPSGRFAQSLWELLSYGLCPLLATHRLHLRNWMPLATVLNCSSLIPSRVIHMPIGNDNIRLSRRATPQCVTSPSAGRRPCQLTFCRGTLRTTNRFYRRMRIGAAQRKLSRNHGERFLAPGYACAPRAEWLRCYRDTVLPKGAHVWYKGDDGMWWLGKISASTTEDGVYLVRVWTIRGRSSSLFPRRATRPQRGPYEVLGACRFT